jgi:putative mRNA 3-end processing factor
MDPSSSDLVVARPEGLYCPPGDFYIDPWQPVAHALVTHAHGDHLRPGHAHDLVAEAARHVVTSRVGAVDLQALPYGEAIVHRGVRVRGPARDIERLACFRRIAAID